MAVWVGTEPFDAGRCYSDFLNKAQGAGAAVCFTGIVRSSAEAPLIALELECYAELAVTEIDAMRSAALARFRLLDAAILHRHGRLGAGETIMQVMTLAPHRAAAFDGASFLMDFLKTDAPFWKKEIYVGRETWVEPRDTDLVSRRRWQQDQ